jgi:hypothetical protein
MIAGPVLGGVVAGAIGTRSTFLALAACSLLLAVWGAFEPDARAPAERESSFLPALRVAAAERLIAVSFILILLVAVIGGTLQVLMPLHLRCCCCRWGPTCSRSCWWRSSRSSRCSTASGTHWAPTGLTVQGSGTGWCWG